MFNADKIERYHSRILIQAFETVNTYKSAFQKNNSIGRGFTTLLKAAALDLAQRVEHLVAIAFIGLTTISTLTISPLMGLLKLSSNPKISKHVHQYFDFLSAQTFLLKDLALSSMTPLLLINESNRVDVINGYLSGVGIEKDIEKAKSIATKGVNLKNPHPGVIRSLGEVYDETNELSLAALYYLKAAQNGDVTSMVNIADMHLNGEGVKQDLALAKHWYEKAADKNHPEACYQLSFYYLHGTAGTQVDKTRGIELLKKAVKGQFEEANVPLGIQLYQKGSPKGLKLAKQLFEMAAKTNDWDAVYLLGLMHSAGKGTKKDIQAALKFFTRAALHGQPQAQNALGTMFLQGTGVIADPKAAKKWFAQAAKQNHPVAQYELAKIYIKEGTPIARQKAKALLAQASPNHQGAKILLDTLVEQDKPAPSSFFNFFYKK